MCAAVLQSLPVSCHFRGCKAPLFSTVSGAISSELALPFLRRLNQALSVLSISLDFLSLSVVLLISDPFLHCVILCHFCVLCLLVILVRLSVPVHVIDWKDSSPKCPIM